MLIASKFTYRVPVNSLSAYGILTDIVGIQKPSDVDRFNSPLFDPDGGK